MAPYQVQHSELAQDLGRYEEPAADWGASAAPDAQIAEDDWASVHGFCHALRPGAEAARPAAAADEADDWGYGVHAL
jgi:hypothetical protein